MTIIGNETSQKCCGPLHKGQELPSTEFGKNQKVCRKCKSDYNKRRYAKMRDVLLAKNKEWKKANRERMREYEHNWRAKNPEASKAYYHRYSRKLETRLIKRIINRVQKEVKITLTRPEALEWLGCSIEEWKAWLEKMFTPGMSWVNWGAGRRVWEIDHHVPISAFDKNPDAIKKAMHYTNTRPLWAKDNKRKGSIVPESPLQQAA